MRCPKCQHLEDKVIDSRLSKNGTCIRRRRECLNCQHRFSTIESIITNELFVVKQDGTREEFNPQKIRQGIEKACYKLKITENDIDLLMQRILPQIDAKNLQEIPTRIIGEIVMEELKKFNEVAYVRFASVYRRFKDIDQFMEAVRELNKEGK